MRNRILEIAESPARLRVERRQLVISVEPHEERVPLEELAVLVVSHPQVIYTQAVLSEIAASGGTFVTCDSKRMPVGILLPIEGHSTQTERFRKQLEFSRPKQKRAWKQIVHAKITMQAALLEERLGADSGLLPLLSQIRSGDPSNIEGRAARKYWTALFGSDFRRDRDAAGHNAMLNYGYAILRSATARSIVAAGLHPSVGLHHHNKYNAYCLVDDLMEPYRAVVDQAVAGLIDGYGEVGELTQVVRREILAAFTGWVVIDGQQRTLFDALEMTASSLAGIVTDERDSLLLPEGFAYAEA